MAAKAPPTFERLAYKAALAISKKLAAIAEADQSKSSPARLTYRAQLLATKVKTWQQALDRDWSDAADKRLFDVEAALRFFNEELATQKTQLDSRPVVGAKQVLDDILAIKQEFAAVSIDLQARSLTVQTERIVFAENNLDVGPFNIVWSWKDLPEVAYTCPAVDPNPAYDRPEVTHPHIEDDLLCEGESKLPIKAALKEGRIFDFFFIVRQVLRTFNDGGEYVSIYEWDEDSEDRPSCCDCDDLASYSCSNCGNDLCRGCRNDCCHAGCERYSCSECNNKCKACGNAVCDRHSRDCNDCGEPHCHYCLHPCNDCSRQVCSTCLKGGNKCSNCQEEEDNNVAAEEECEEEREEAET